MKNLVRVLLLALFCFSAFGSIPRSITFYLTEGSQTHFFLDGNNDRSSDDDSDIVPLGGSFTATVYFDDYTSGCPSIEGMEYDTSDIDPHGTSLSLQFPPYGNFNGQISDASFYLDGDLSSGNLIINEGTSTEEGTGNYVSIYNSRNFSTSPITVASGLSGSASLGSGMGNCKVDYQGFASDSADLWTSPLYVHFGYDISIYASGYTDLFP